jgi:hypothetical protein
MRSFCLCDFCKSLTCPPDCPELVKSKEASINER